MTLSGALLFALASALPPPVIAEIEHPTGIKGMRVTFDVAAPRDHALAVLWDVSGFTRIFPDVKQAKVARVVSENETYIDFVVDAAFRDATYTLRRTRDPVAGRIAWQSTAGDVTNIVGSWTLTPLTATTSRVVYESYVDIGFIVPTALIRNVAMGRATKMVERVRAAVAQPPTLPSTMAAPSPSAASPTSPPAAHP